MDVSLGTIRVIFISKEMKGLSALVGFFEILIWLFAISNIMKNLNNPAIFFAYAGGYAYGTFVGVWIEERLSIGQVIVQIVAHQKVDEMIDALKNFGFKVTIMNAQSFKGSEVKFIFTVTGRKNVQQLIDLIKSFDPDAFYSIEDVKSVSAGILTPHKKNKFVDYLKPLAK